MSIDDHFEYSRFESGHLDGVVSCARVLEWPSYAEPAVALAAFSAPGSVTWVATHEGEVIGLAHLLTNGVVHSHLSLIGVLPDYRRRGVARRLVTAVFEQAGGKWIDLCSEPGSEAFYRSFRHQEQIGFRIHPSEPQS
jgi:ribosomal protein S18 acetylase RimI-like enzyme